jgi:hypothetical protein
VKELSATHTILNYAHVDLVAAIQKFLNRSPTFAINYTGLILLVIEAAIKSLQPHRTAVSINNASRVKGSAKLNAPTIIAKC